MNDEDTRIKVTLGGNKRVEHVPDETTKYRWQVGMAGELIIYRITLHAMLSAQSEPRVWTVYAPGTWLKVVDEE